MWALESITAQTVDIITMPLLQSIMHALKSAQQHLDLQ